VRLFSATKRIGIEEVAMVLWDWAHPEVLTSDTPPVPPEADL